MTAGTVHADIDIGREEIDQLAEAGHLDASQREQALRMAGIVPDTGRWQQFLARLFLLLGVTFLIAAVGFFVAYNWNDMGRFAKIALLEAVVAAAALTAARFAADDLRGRAALLGAVLATGPLLAYIGQTYQTGADTYELFRAWALLALPWVLLARWRPLWAVWILIVNLAISLYFAEAWQPLAASLTVSTPLLVHIAVNAGFLLALEACAGRLEGGGRSAERLAIALVLAAALFLYFLFLFDRHSRALWQPLSAALVFAAVWFVYRLRRLDLLALALWCFCLIAVAAATIAKLLFEARAETSALLLSGVVTISLSAWAAVWLRQVGRKGEGA